jgi:tRNA nucleotidyltransferase/poly(A) polymerase
MGPHAEDSFVLDPNGIMRYFKSVSAFAHPRLVSKDLDWIRHNVHLLKDAEDDQRVQMNLISIMKGPSRDRALRLMCALGVDTYIPYLPC